MKKTTKRMMVLFLAIMVVISCVVPAFAASTSNITTGGNGKYATTFTVQTSKATTMKFTQKQGTISYTYMATGSSSFSSYGDFFIYVVDNSGKESPKSYYSSLQASTSSTIKLSANKTYTITICPQAKFTTNRKLTEQGKFRYRLSGDSSFTWSKVPTWTITAYNVLSLKNIKTTIAPQQ